MSVLQTNLDIDLSDGEYILEDDALVCTNKGKKQIPPSQDDSESVLDTLRFIQEGNPNIEAVFVEESDEEVDYINKDVAASRDFRASSKYTLAEPTFPKSSREAIARVELNEADPTLSSQTIPKNTSVQARPAFPKANDGVIYGLESDDEENSINEKNTTSASKKFQIRTINTSARPAFPRSYGKERLRLEPEKGEKDISKKGPSSSSHGDNPTLASRISQTSPKNTLSQARPAFSKSNDGVIYGLESDDDANSTNKENTTSASKKFQILSIDTLVRPAFPRSKENEIITIESEEEENNISGEDTSSASETENFQSSSKTASFKSVTSNNANQKVGNASVTQNPSPKLNVTPNTSILPRPKQSVYSNSAPLRVKEVPSATLTSGFMKNANTIILDNPNSSTKQILVIPNDVLPLIASSMHPITLNVPGVGPVVINKSKTLTPRPVKPLPDPPLYDPLCDSKYQFWKYRKGIKRDLEGFSINDRLGFFKAEQARSKMCMIYYEQALKKMKYEFEELSRKHGLMQKPVVVDKVKINRNVKKENIKEERVENLTPIQKKNLHVIKRWKEHFTKKAESSSSEDEENLLVRKKQLEKRKLKPKRKRRKQEKTFENPYLKKYNTYQNATNKIIHTLEDLELEINPNIPVIVINKENYLTTNFEKLQLKNNLVYPSATERDIPKILVNNAALYNLLFVMPDILDKYLAGMKKYHRVA